MNITMKELREVGYRRIWKIMIKHCKEQEDVDFLMNNLLSQQTGFMARIYKLAILLSPIKIEPYIAVKYAQCIERLSDREAGGLKRLMCDAQAWVAYDTVVDNSTKRKFRYSWETIWEQFGSALSLSEHDLTMLQVVGLKLPIFLSAIEHDDSVAKTLVGNTEAYTMNTEQDIHMPEGMYQAFDYIRDACMFYNMVLGWYLSVQSKQDTDDLLCFLLETDFDDFRNFFADGTKIWTR